MPRRTFALKALFLALCLIHVNQIISVNAQSRARQQPPPKPLVTEKKPAQPVLAPDYSQEAIILEQLKMLYRFEKDGTGQRE